jgi:hypothetical protein
MLDDLQAGKTLAGWAPGKAFEYIILREFEIEGARVVWPYSVLLQKKQIEQIDGAVYHEHLCCLVEAKDRDGTEGIEPIAKLRNQLIRRPAATIGLVFTTSQFSEPAKLLTRMMNPLSILMWEFGELRDAVGKAQICRALQTKFMYAVEWGMPDYDTRKGIR